MAINTPHFDLPFRFTGSGHAVTIEQGTEKDIKNCVNAALRTTRGTRLYVPNFGIEDFVFDNMPIDENTLIGQLLDSEPRAEVEIIQNILASELTDEISVALGSGVPDGSS